MERDLYEKMNARFDECMATAWQALHVAQSYKDLLDVMAKKFEKRSLVDFIKTVLIANEEKSIVFIDKILMNQIDIKIKSGEYQNRSEALETLIRKELKGKSSYFI